MTFLRIRCTVVVAAEAGSAGTDAQRGSADLHQAEVGPRVAVPGAAQRAP